MKKLLPFLLMVNCGILAAQSGIGIRHLTSFPNPIMDGASYTISMYIRNETPTTFSGLVDIRMSVNIGNPILLADDYPVNNLLSGDSILYVGHGYVFPTSAFSAGVNDILIWPESPGYFSSGKFVGQVVFIAANVVINNRGSFNPYQFQNPTPPTSQKYSEGNGETALIEEAISVYPNPTSDCIHLSRNEFAVRVYDYQGGLMAEYPKGVRLIDLSGFATGNYLLKIGEGETEQVYPVIKK